MSSSTRMSKEERERFLAGVHVGVLCVSAGDGQAPLAVPVWYGYQPGGTVNVTTGSKSRKAIAIVAAGRFSLCAQDERPPFRYVTVEGPAVIESAGLSERTELACRYLGDEEGRAWIGANLETDDIMIRMTPERWMTADFGQA